MKRSKPELYVGLVLDYFHEPVEYLEQLEKPPVNKDQAGLSYDGTTGRTWETNVYAYHPDLGWSESSKPLTFFMSSIIENNKWLPPTEYKGDYAIFPNIDCKPGVKYLSLDTKLHKGIQYVYWRDSDNDWNVKNFIEFSTPTSSITGDITTDRVLNGDLKSLFIEMLEVAGSQQHQLTVKTSVDWIKTSDRLPPPETKVLISYLGDVRIATLELETPTYEETFKAFNYWCLDDSHEIDCWEDVTYWAELPTPPLESVT